MNWIPAFAGMTGTGRTEKLGTSVSATALEKTDHQRQRVAV